MMIDSVESRLFFVPLPTVMTDSTHGEMRHFSVITASIKTTDGAEGLGYTYTVGKTGGPAVLSMIQHDLAPLLQGADAAAIDTLWDQMWWRLHYVGRGGIASFAMSAIDIALWDLNAKVAGQPLWRHLGGQSPEVQPYAGGIDLLLPIDQLLDKTRNHLDAGFRAIKMKVGRENLDDDIERVAAMRDLLGSDIPLMVDANMRWSVDEAIRASRAFAQYDVFWLEEPTIPDDVHGHRRIISEAPLPVAAGENLHTLYEFEKMIAVEAVSYPEPDVTNVGGVTTWNRVAALASANNLPVTSHGVHDLHVHLLAAAPNASFLEVHGFGLEAYIAHPMRVADGYTIAPDRPGHGVEFDWQKLSQHEAS